jgi:L-fucose isomerase-like protein
MRMINTRKLLSQSRLLSITNVEEISEKRESFLGINVRIVPFSLYAERFKTVQIDREARKLIRGFTKKAKEVRVTREALENAARAHLTLREMIGENDAHGVTMTCLRAGMLKPCVSFSMLNGQLFPAACENDMSAAYSLFLGEALTGRGGFQHNPAFATERNHYYGSHCTCTASLHGPDGPVSPHILRKFFHSNEGSCAIQTFWKENEPVTMIHYYTGQPASLDIYAGKVYKSHNMPPAGGCTTNVEIEITDGKDALAVKGHHNILFCGDYARKFRLFANLYKMDLV